MKRVAINGLGRTGRMVLRCYLANQPADVEVVAANDLVPPETLAYLLHLDSVHGRTPYSVKATDGQILMGEHRIKVFAEKEPAHLPWKDLGIDTVIESTGIFTKRELAAKHLEAGTGASDYQCSCS